MGPNFFKKTLWIDFQREEGGKTGGKRKRERERERFQFVVPFIYALIGLFLYVP